MPSRQNTRPTCRCEVADIDKMAHALLTSANGDPALLLKGRVALSRHLASHVMPDAERRRLEGQYAELLRAPVEFGPEYEVF